MVLTDGIFKTIPSKIAKSGGKFYCGNYIPVNCLNIIHSFKISIGVSNENKNIFKFDNDDQEYTHQDLLVIFFKHLYEIIWKNIKLTNNNNSNHSSNNNRAHKKFNNQFKILMMLCQKCWNDFFINIENK